MENRLAFYVPFIYLLAAIPYMWLALYAWRRRPAVAITPFVWTMLAMSIWSFLYSLEIFFPDLPTKLFITKIEYIGIIAIPNFLLFFVLEFTGKGHLLSARARLWLWSIPLLILMLVWTNEFHHLMWDMETVTETNGLKLLDIRYGPFFWVNVLFSYSVLLVADLLLIMEMIQRPGIYRIQISLLVLGIIMPWVGILIFITRVNTIQNLDLTPLFFLPTAAGLSWAIARFRLLEILPLEHIAVLKNMKDGVIIINSSKRVLHINPLVEGLLGRSEADVIGQPLSYISEKYGGRLESYLMDTEHQTEIMIEVGKQAKVYEVTVSPVSGQDTLNNPIGPDTMIILHDITQRKETETAQGRRETIMSAIGLAAEQFLKESAWEQNIPGALKKIGQAASVSRIYVFVNYSDQQDVVYSSQCYEWAAPGISPQINNPRLQHVPLRGAGFSRWYDHLSNREPILGVVSGFPASEQDVLKDQGILSMALMPIFVDNQWWGFIGFDQCDYERHWTGTELEALHIVASLFGSAETRTRTEQKLIRRQRTLNLLHEIVGVSLKSEDLLTMSQTLVKRLGELIDADGCFIALWDEVNKVTQPLAAHGSSRESYLNLKFEPGKLSFAESAFKMGQTLIVEDIATSSYADRLIIQKIRSHSMIVIPLISGIKRLGTIFLLFDRHHRFQPEEISISEQAANLIMLAFEKFEALEQAQRRADTSETLRKASAAISETLEMKQAVIHILEQLNQVVPYNSASVQLLEGNELHIIGGRGWDNPGDIIGMRFTIPGDNPNTIVIQTGKAYIVPDVQKVYKVFREQPQEHIHSWLGVPLIVQDKIIGLLAIDSGEPNHFTEEDINIASAFAYQVAVTLENARIFKETQNQAITDPLTGLYNRWGLFQLGRNEFARSVRLSHPFSGIMVDLDHFKKINDTYGHSAGDLALREFANRCKSCVREIDFVGRYGGEEIIILLPDTNLETSLIVAERLRTAITSKPMKVSEGMEVYMTASLGVAQRDENTINLEMLIARTDQAMYVAKEKGRNRVATSS